MNSDLNQLLTFISENEIEYGSYKWGENDFVEFYPLKECFNELMMLIFNASYDIVNVNENVWKTDISYNRMKN